MEQVLVPEFKATQVEMSPKGDRVYYYGNSGSGQWIGSFSTSERVTASNGSPSKVIAKKIATSSWQWGDSTALEFSSFISPFKNLVGGAFGLNKPKTRENHLMFFTGDGQTAWDLLPKSDEGAYVYDYHVADQGTAPFVVVGMDDGYLNGFLL